VDSYRVTRRAGTESPETGELVHEHRTGVFRCICCDNALFSSNAKFESGTGWPSFWEPIAAENLYEKMDASLGMVRREGSARCATRIWATCLRTGPIDGPALLHEFRSAAFFASARNA